MFKLKLYHNTTFLWYYRLQPCFSVVDKNVKKYNSKIAVVFNVLLIKMESGKNRVTTKQQFEKLVELMEKHPETGRGKPQFGCSKNKNKELWEEFASMHPKTPGNPVFE
ncbi:uncharacterized protein LOC124419578 [Lucilia cuprina]|uniref:uncharacterized protein LOC124419578 n=1 Tax=Lucilia cuprina TaxID=7375 RepID=UPI001F06B888|nr:uncharacterized protein LOC124419578 [Lucilia cuprina]